MDAPRAEGLDWLAGGLDVDHAAGRERIRLAMESLGLAFFQTDLTTGNLFVTPNAFVMFGLPTPATMPVRSAPFWECYHPDDIGWARERFAADLRRERGRDTYCERVRIFRRDDGALRWIEFSGTMFGPPGARTHIVGMLRDVTAAAEAEERHALLLREVNHRANNTLAVAQSLILLTKAPDLPEYRARLEARLRSLARTHSLLASPAPTRIEAVIEGELAAFRDHLDLMVAEMPPLAADAVQPLAMILHEFGTNAAKHGALSQPGGRVKLDVGIGDGQVLLTWQEAGGPPVVAPPTRKGTGTAVIAAQCRRLRATMRCTWERGGMTAELRFPLPRPDA